MIMAFYHRKSLISQANRNPNFSKKFDSDSCYLCYVCPQNCYLSPPPSLPQLFPPPELSPSTKNHIPTVLILMICVLGVAFLVLSYLTIYRYRNSCRRNPPLLPPETLTANFADESHRSILDHPIWFIRTVGLPQSVIDSIVSFAYQNDDGLIDGNDCSVCLNDFRQNETLKLLPKCSHAFHLDCIDTWLRSHKNCPVCRAPVVVDNGDVHVSSIELSSSNSRSGELENPGEIEREDEPIIIGIDGLSDDVARNEKLRVMSDLVDRMVQTGSFDSNVQPLRRSVSMDLSISYEVGDEGSSNHSRFKTAEKSNSGGSFRVKRSFSFSGKRKNSKTVSSS